MAITYARSAKGRRAHGPKPHNKGKNLTVIAAIAITGVIAALSFFDRNKYVIVLVLCYRCPCPQVKP